MLAAADRIPAIRRQLAGIVDDIPRNPLMVRRRLALLAELELLAAGSNIKTETEGDHR